MISILESVCLINGRKVSAVGKGPRHPYSPRLLFRPLPEQDPVLGPHSDTDLRTIFSHARRARPHRQALHDDATTALVHADLRDDSDGVDGALARSEAPPLEQAGVFDSADDEVQPVSSRTS